MPLEDGDPVEPDDPDGLPLEPGEGIPIPPLEPELGGEPELDGDPGGEPELELEEVEAQPPAAASNSAAHRAMPDLPRDS